MKIQSYLCGEWKSSSNTEQILQDASTGEAIGEVGTEGLNIEEALNFGRLIGGKNLRQMTFHERAQILKQLALYLLEKKEVFYECSSKTGATRADSWIDIEGGIGNLFVYSSKGRRELPNDYLWVDGKSEMLSKAGSFQGQHIYTPLHGISIHINAFNFPVWGMLEKFAVNFLAGVPALIKPATITCYLTELVVREMINSKLLPQGSLQLVCGSVHNFLDFVDSQDVVTFTGSLDTGIKLKSHPRLIKKSVRFNMEADSLNCSILGLDVTIDSPEFELYIKEVAREMTIKAGQKCTAIRRMIVPEHMIVPVCDALKARLLKTVIGDPRSEGVRMGPLASKSQKDDVLQKIQEIEKNTECLLDKNDFPHILGEPEKGAFVSPTLLLCNDPQKTQNNYIHELEAFGPVSTMMPYKTVSDAITLANKGEGSLVGSVISYDSKFMKEVVVGTASYHGRLHFLNRDCAKESTGHGSPMPQMSHGGPGRAGGGDEMGGLRGLTHYMQRTALQGDPTTLSFITNTYLNHAKQIQKEIHPFRKYFEELEIGETLVTHKRTVTESDIVNFANLSWDHFYAHTDDTSFDGTLFERRVAHGYFVISMAAGLFVDAKKGPVLANYGLDELRFIKPVYVGATLGVKLTVKEKISQMPREGESPRGVVKWLVDVYDETGETVALATILTLVEKKS